MSILYDNLCYGLGHLKHFKRFFVVEINSPPPLSVENSTDFNDILIELFPKSEINRNTPQTPS